MGRIDGDMCWRGSGPVTVWHAPLRVAERRQIGRGNGVDVAQDWQGEASAGSLGRFSTGPGRANIAQARKRCVRDG